LERQPVEFLQRRLPDLFISVRKEIARFLHTQMENILLVTNITVGFNIVARSLKLGPGDEVLTTDHEYGSMNTMWQYLANQKGFKYVMREVPLPIVSAEQFIESFWQGVTPNTKVIFISHITSPTAIIFPVKEICARARKAGILTVVDGAHVPGQLPLDLEDIGADFYSVNLHNWVCSPKGAAFLYARKEVFPMLEPLILTAMWKLDRPADSSPLDMMEYIGTRDPAAFLAIPDAIRFLEENHWDVVRTQCHELAADTRRRLTEISGLPAYCPDSMEWYSQMGTAMLPKNIDPAKLKAFLYDQYRIEVPVGEWKGHNQIRFSFQAYNSQSDVDSMIHAVEDYIRKG